MNRNILIMTSLVFLLSSCCGLHTEIDYEYQGVMIRRVDECGRSTFFYHNEGRQGQGKIVVEYSGINDGFSGYLKFEETGRVVLLSGDGHFQMQDVDTTNFIYKRIYSYSRPTLDDAVYQIMLSTKHEIERNAKSQSTVKAKYRIDKNEWF